MSILRVLTGMFPVSRYIDQGRNPQLYTKECLERALAKNEQVKGKIDTMKVSEAPGSRAMPGEKALQSAFRSSASSSLPGAVQRQRFYDVAQLGLAVALLLGRSRLASVTQLPLPTCDCFHF